MTSKTKKLVVYVKEKQYEYIRRTAFEEKKSMSTLLGEMIDQRMNKIYQDAAIKGFEERLK